MSVLSLIQSAAVQGLAIEPPASVMSSTEQEHLELAATINEIGERIARSAEWRVLTRKRVLTGDGTDKRFPLPDDFDRFTTAADLRSDRFAGGCLYHVQGVEEWHERTASGFSGVPAWTLLGGEIEFDTAPAAGEQISFFYLSRFWAASNAGTLQGEFKADDDTFRLSERTLRLALVAQWRANKGLDYQMQAGIADRALAEDTSRDAGPRMIRVGRARWPRDVRPAYPWPINP